MPKYTFSIYDGSRDIIGNKPIPGCESLEIEKPNDDLAIAHITEVVTRLERVYVRKNIWLYTHIYSNGHLVDILITDSQGTI